MPGMTSFAQVRRRVDHLFHLPYQSKGQTLLCGIFGGEHTCPFQVFSSRLSVSVAGLSLELIHAPGETDDQVIGTGIVCIVLWAVCSVDLVDLSSLAN